MTDAEEIRDLIERWVAAVHEGDLEAVLAHHDPEIVMFDVPPPERGLRGLSAYGEAWPPFFAWQASGAQFELVELEIEAGETVAFAFALLRCGTPAELEADPDRRLRLTIGLRKEGGAWLVTHEHHSFTDPSPPAAEQEIRAIQDGWTAQTAASARRPLRPGLQAPPASSSSTGAWITSPPARPTSGLAAPACSSTPTAVGR